MIMQSALTVDISHPVVCFGDSDWWYHNHGHMDIQLMRRFAATGRVLYINSIVVRKFNVSEGTMFFRRVKRKLKSIMQGLKPSGIENMFIYSPFTLPVHHIKGAREINNLLLKLQVRRCMRNLCIQKPIIWVACPGAGFVATKLPHSKIVYQRSDRYEQFPGVDPDMMARYDQFLKKRADLVVYVNKKLMEQESGKCKKTIFLDHGVDYEAFADAYNNPCVPSEMMSIPHPIAGFYGNIDEHTSDISLIERLADILTDVSIVLIGNASVDLGRLALHKNVFLLGQKPYDRIPHYAKCFDVCFMPWQQNQWIEACNPVKLKEYLALGKPVVSTPFPQLDGYRDLVSVALGAKDFAEQIRKACYEADPAPVFARRQRVRNSTWDAKAQEVMDALSETK